MSDIKYPMSAGGNRYPTCIHNIEILCNSLAYVKLTVHLYDHFKNKSKKRRNTEIAKWVE